MNRIIKRQIFALDMEALTFRFQHLQMEDKVVTLLNELWDELCINTTERRKVEITNDENRMEIMVGELLVPTFYFMNEKKFLRHLKNILKSQVQSEYWLKFIIRQNFVSNWSNEPSIPWYWSKQETFTFKQ